MMLVSNGTSDLCQRHSKSCILDENVNEHCNLGPCTSYTDYHSDEAISSRSSSPIRGSSRDAIGEVYSYNDFEIVEKLGEGFFGFVYRVKSLLDVPSPRLPDTFVMKVAKIMNDTEAARLSAKQSVEREAAMLRKLQHPNILEFYGLCVEVQSKQWFYHLIVDFCDQGSLHQLIMDRNQDFPWLQRCMIAMDVANAMRYVNAKGYMHRDLTDTNILLQTVPNFPFPKAVVADFGLSASIPKAGEHGQQVGTQNFMSPEMLLEKPYNEKSDVFSYGIILCQIIARIEADHDAGLYRTSSFGVHYEPFSEVCPKDTPVGLLSLAFACCRYQPSHRPSFEDIYEAITLLVEEDVRKWTYLAAKEGPELRFGRSHSDAALRTSTPAPLRIDAVPFVSTIHEGIPLEVDVENIQPMTVGASRNRNKANEIRKIALDFAANEPDDYYSKNPFRADARIRHSSRKIKPSESFTKRRSYLPKKCPVRREMALPVRPLICLDRSQSLPSVLEDLMTPDIEYPLPMDSHSDSLKKMSLNYVFGAKMTHSTSGFEQDSALPRRKNSDQAQAASPATFTDSSESDDSDEGAFSEASTDPLPAYLNHRRLSATPSTSFSDTISDSAPTFDTVVREAVPAKRRLCSFAQYPETPFRRRPNRCMKRSQTDSNCVIL
uniref:Protein kinase domain-containing protein n=1 Tax=Panagrellus redivivus TaxID=6233 RepID=A0A7E4VH01_PANRE